jgi:death-on-curing protein
MEEARQTIIYLNRNILINSNRNYILNDEECLNKEFGGRVCNNNSLEYILDIVKNDDRVPSLQEKAAKYCYKIITDHVFCDANKRTGTGAIFMFLEKNNAYLPRLSDERVVSIALEIAQGKMSEPTLVGLIQKHIRLKKRVYRYQQD